MLPNKCSIRKDGRQCSNPPEFIVTITCIRTGDNGITADGMASADADEYMIGVTCGRHRQNVLAEVRRLQAGGKITEGEIGFSPVKSVGTDCIRGDPDDLVQIDTSDDQNSKIYHSH